MENCVKAFNFFGSMRQEVAVHEMSGHGFTALSCGSAPTVPLLKAIREATVVHSGKNVLGLAAYGFFLHPARQSMASGGSVFGSADITSCYQTKVILQQYGCNALVRSYIDP